MATMSVGSRVPLHCCALEPKIKVCGKSWNPLGESKRGLWRAQLRSHSFRPLQLVKQQRASFNSPRIGTANKGSTTMEAMSSGRLSSNKREEATVSAGGRTREELKKLVMRAVTNTNRGKASQPRMSSGSISLLSCRN